MEFDFPRRFQIPAKYQTQNNNLKNALKVTGYPTIWEFNPKKDAATGKYEINAMGKTGYAPGVGEFTSAVDGMLKSQPFAVRLSPLTVSRWPITHTTLHISFALAPVRVSSPSPLLLLFSQRVQCADTGWA